MKRYKKIIAILLSIALIISTFGIFEVSAATNDTRYSKKYLQNGGFEKDKTSYKWRTDHYVQPFKDTVPYWDTTAYGNDGTKGMFEFFEAGALHFSQSSTNKKVAEGTVAAELNADEVSTIYQRIETVSGSTYTWGLDHRGRDTTDTMVLFIGPEQYKTVDGVKTAIDPSKPNKNGKDQFVKMTDWLKTQYGVSYPATGCSQKYTVYSKPFDKNGAFQNESKNANENFSMTPTDECTEEWNLWVISSSNNNTSTNEFEAVNGWSKYGTNCYNENDNSYNDVINGAGSKLKYDCTYTVPKGQTKTLFAFCSFTVNPNRKSNNSYVFDATFGNLLDDINFKLYQPISSSITEGGTGGVHIGNATITNDLQNGNLFYSTVNDGNECTIHTKVTDGTTGHTFQGAYVTVYDDEGNPQTKFVDVYTGDTTGKTDEELLELSRTHFVRDDYYIHEGGETWDYFYTIKVDSPVHIHMMYTKAPYVLYDSNGGEPYQWTEDNSVGGNLVGFRDGFKGLAGVDSSKYYVDAIVKEKTENGNTILITEKAGFYKSHAALPNSKWQTNDFGIGAKFLGWTFNDADGNIITVDGNHTVTYAPNETVQGAVTITDGKNNVSGLTLDATNGITLTAQWQFGYTAQAQTLVDSVEKTYENTALGGWVEETFIDKDSGNVTDYKDDYIDDRTERTDAYAAVGETIIFRANADSANNYVFEGWYTIDENGVETRISTTPNLPISVKEGKSTTYYARFKTKTVPVVFHYSASGASNGYDYYLKDTDNKYGKYFQDVVYNEKAKQPPTNLNPKVTMWFTSPTDRDQEHLFNFSTQITEETHLYASPSFTFNYFNYFRFKEPWRIDTYATLKLNGKYIDMKKDADMTNYNIYMLKGSVGDTTPAASDIKSNYTKKVSKSDSAIKFNQTTNTGQTFNRAGTSFDDFYIFNMKTPVWVLFDFTYKGITYTSAIKNRCLYNNIGTYMAEEKNGLYTTFPPETQAKLRTAQTNLLNSMTAMYDKIAKSNITEPTPYKDGVSVSGLTYDGTASEYTFTSSTAMRNIEPWGLKYTFSVDGQTTTDFSDYGAVVLTDKSGTYTETPSISQILDDSNSLLYSKSKSNIYSTDNGSVEIYHINDLLTTDFDINTYVVFFVKDSNGKYHYSSVTSKTYNELSQQDTSEVSQSIFTYAQRLVEYYTAIQNAQGATA